MKTFRSIFCGLYQSMTFATVSLDREYQVERHSLGERCRSRKTVPDPRGGRNKKQPDAGSQ